MGLDWGQAGTMALAVLIAAFVRGYSGFGFSALVVAVAGIVTDPRDFVPVVILCELAMSCVQARGVTADVAWRRVAAMLAGAAVALPVALWLLARIGEDTARLGISVGILGLCLLLLSGWTIRRRIGTAGHLVVGAAAGLANGAAVGGLPVAAFLSAQPLPAAVFRATMVAFLTALDIVALPLMAWHGMVRRDTLLVALGCLPLLLIGVTLGSRHFLAASPQGFRRMAVLLLSVLAALGLMKSLI